MKRKVLGLSLLFLPITLKTVEHDRLKTVEHYRLNMVEKSYVKESVTATVYNAIEGQTDSTPLITATGFKIDKQNFPRIIAVSKDLEKSFPMGSVVEVCGVGEYEGSYTVEDRMHPRWKKKIDILVPDHIKTGKWKNVNVSLLRSTSNTP